MANSSDPGSGTEGPTRDWRRVHRLAQIAAQQAGSTRHPFRLVIIRRIPGPDLGPPPF